MTALTKLHLYGPLADRYGAEHEVPVGVTILDAVRIVECNHPGFLMNVRRGKFHVAVGNGRVGYNVNDNEVDIELGDSKATEVQLHQIAVPRSTGEWHLVPALTGEKSRTAKIIFMVVVGGALLATGVGGALAGAALPGTGASLGLGFGLGLSTGVLGLTYGTVALMGAAFLLGGINMLMTPTPKSDTGERKPTAFSFDGPSEVEDEGGPIPILIGELMIGGVKIASSINSFGGAPTNMKSSTRGAIGSGGGVTGNPGTVTGSAQPATSVPYSQTFEVPAGAGGGGSGRFFESTRVNNL